MAFPIKRMDNFTDLTTLPLKPFIQGSIFIAMGAKSSLISILL
ncbi:MAG: hypothetical protein ACTHML_16940 [Ginsengibacter sp.]